MSLDRLGAAHEGDVVITTVRCKHCGKEKVR
jgi:C4-type Zn-finger protein